jgi:hypothetical protein
MTEVLDFAQKLSGLGFGTFLVLILYGSYKGVWVWGRQLHEAKQDVAEWKAMALHAAGLAETTVNIAKTRI